MCQIRAAAPRGGLFASGAMVPQSAAGFPCPGRGAAFFTPLRRSGAVPRTEFGTVPGLQRTAAALRRARDKY